MSYDLAVWEGDRPATNAGASRIFDELYDEASGQVIGPSRRIQDYVEGLLARCPDIDSEAAEDPPWADGPLIGTLR